MKPTLLPDLAAIVVVIASTVASTHWAGSVVSGQDLVALYGLTLGYVFGRNTPTA
jgi:hypothetical protein